MSRALWAIARLILVILISVLAAIAARAESDGGAPVRPGPVTEGSRLWRTAEQDALVPAPALRTCTLS